MEDQNEMTFAVGIFMIVERDWQGFIRVGCEVREDAVRQPFQEEEMTKKQFQGERTWRDDKRGKRFA